MKRVKEFLTNHWDGKSPLLLGYSGGPDSKALLYSLLEIVGSRLHVAHVDHGWREESREEARQIRKEIEGLKLSFHSKRLNMASDKNKEEEARFARLHFFQNLFEQTPFQALLLGHHADDLAETSLKRIFEGAHLPFLGGMEPVGLLEGIPVFRPLLKMKKQELVSYLEERGLNPLIDSTNFDPVYLRSRLRMETIPFLHQSFGKNILDNLCLLSERAHELKRYLDQRVAAAQILEGDWGFSVFCLGFERIERRHLLQKIAAGHQLSLPRTVLEQVLDWIPELEKRRKVFFQSRWITVYRGWVYFFNYELYK